MQQSIQRFDEEAYEVLLQQMVDWIKGLLRIEDLVVRVDPHDFAIILTGSKPSDANTACHCIVGIL